MGKKSGPPAPDYSDQIAQQNELSQQSLDFYTRVYEEDILPRQQEFDRILQEVSDVQLETMNFGLDAAREDRERYNRDFVPVEASLVAESMGLDPGPAVTAAREAMFEQAAGETSADINQAYATAQQDLVREAGRYGLTPTSLASQSTAIALQKARDMAFGTTQARRNAATDSFNQRLQTAAIGRGVDVGTNARTSTATNAGSSAVGTGAAGINSTIAGANVQGTGFNSAGQFGMNAGSLMNTQFNNQVSSSQAGSSPLGTLIGTGLGMFTGGVGAGLARSMFN